MIEIELVRVTRALSLCEDLGSVMQTLGSAARRMTGADGVTLVLREGTQCHYADEDAIAPLWKGRRFPMEACISGWSMLNRQPVAIPDIYADPRIPHEAYRPTFVKSLAMAPIRVEDPIGAIGVYWEAAHHPSDGEMETLQALAESAAVVRNLRQIEQLTTMVQEATDALLLADRKLVLRRDPLDLRRIVRDCAERSRAACLDAGVELLVEVQDAPVWIVGDRVRLSQAVANIIEESFKRIPSGGRLSVRLIADHQALLVVQATPVRESSGQPLAIAVAKTLVRLHEGSLEAAGSDAAPLAETTLRLPLRAGPLHLH